MTPIFKIALFVLLLCTIGLVGNMDYQDAVAKQERECHMRELWNDDERNGVPAHQRRGWPGVCND